MMRVRADLGMVFQEGALFDSLTVEENLSLDFAGSAKVGDWLETQADVQKAGKTLAFVNGFVLASGKPIVRASAVFALSGTLAKKAPADG